VGKRIVLAVVFCAALAWPGVAHGFPPVTNDATCVPNALLHPHPLGTPASHGHAPVILVHGTAVTPETMITLAASLRATGYCPWDLSYPTGMAPDTAAPNALASFVDTVLASTSNGDGTGKVSMVGHSQGGMQIRHMLLHADKPVDDAISLAGTQKGSAQPLGVMCTQSHRCPPGFEEQLATSSFYDHLNGTGCSVGGPLDDMGCWAPRYGGADYTNVTTVTDELVFPYWRGLMGPYPTQLHPTDPKVSDIVLQVWCPAAQADHLTIVGDPHVFRLILDALGRSGPADASVPCASNPL
jgi:pimeloyl-ACP methyl ester carboxylesterase